MAELYNNKPLFPGKSEFDQMTKICEVIGTPNSNDWPEGYTLASKINYKFPNYKGYKLKSLVPRANDNAIHLLESMLCFNPGKRLSAGQCLQHPYFQCFDIMFLYGLKNVGGLTGVNSGNNYNNNNNNNNNSNYAGNLNNKLTSSSSSFYGGNSGSHSGNHSHSHNTINNTPIRVSDKSQGNKKKISNVLSNYSNLFNSKKLNHTNSDINGGGSGSGTNPNYLYPASGNHSNSTSNMNNTSTPFSLINNNKMNYGNGVFSTIKSKISNANNESYSGGGVISNSNNNNMNLKSKVIKFDDF